MLFDDDEIGISKALYDVSMPRDNCVAFSTDMIPMESHVASIGLPVLEAEEEL